MKEFTTHKLRFTHSTLQTNEASPDLPVDIFPLGLLRVIHILDETVEVKETVCYVLCNNLAMKINKDFCIRTHHPQILIIGIKLPTINASAEKCRALVLALRVIS
jgi:hypothetical protein